jgi:hypothetical protein
MPMSLSVPFFKKRSLSILLPYPVGRRMMGDPTLDELGLKYGTDKNSSGHGYCQIYDELFTPVRHEPIALLELGVAYGASLRMWDEYFDHPDTVIAGIDIHLGGGLGGLATAGVHLPLRQRYGKPLPGIVTYFSDQTEVPSGLKDWHPDIVIDDASHYSSKTIASFKTWFPALRPGGVYVVEDVQTSYATRLVGEEEANPDPDQPPRLRPEAQTTMQFLRRLADEVQAQNPESPFNFPVEPQYRLGFDIDWITFHPNLVVVHKGFSEHHEEISGCW